MALPFFCKHISPSIPSVTPQNALYCVFICQPNIYPIDAVKTILGDSSTALQTWTETDTSIHLLTDPLHRHRILFDSLNA